MPFLRLTRDRRGIEHTFLLHEDHGGRPRLLYWYRTAPGVALGRLPLDEEAIRTIEDRHPDIDFDWPALLALREVMTPEEEEAPIRVKRKPRRTREDGSDASPAPARFAATEEEAHEEVVAAPASSAFDEPSSRSGLLEDLVGREIATRLRTRYAEICRMIDASEGDEASKGERLSRARALNPDAWITPESVLDGVRNADAIFEHLREELIG